MAFCPKCGEKQNDDATFCGACGSPLISGAPKVEVPAKKAQGKSVLKTIMYGVLGIFGLFVCLVIYLMVTDKDVKSDTKTSVQVAAPAAQNQAASKPATPQPPPIAPLPAAIKVTAIQIGPGFDSSKFKVTGAADTFQAAQLDTIHAVVYVEGVTQPISAKGEWVYINTRESVLTNDVTLDKDGAFHYELSKPSNGWPAGEYALKVYVNSKELTYKKFTIR